MQPSKIKMKKYEYPYNSALLYKVYVVGEVKFLSFTSCCVIPFILSRVPNDYRRWFVIIAGFIGNVYSS
jgi:hypothetical protein